MCQVLDQSIAYTSSPHNSMRRPFIDELRLRFRETEVERHIQGHTARFLLFQKLAFQHKVMLQALTGMNPHPTGCL